MNPMFAPWRMEFVEKFKPSDGCPLCRISSAQDEKEFQILGRGKLCFVVMNKFPYSNGHLMVIPNRHESDWTQLSQEESYEIADLTQKSLRAIKLALNPEGFNLGVNLGKAAGAGIEGHVHQHIVPRWLGDMNFMPLLAEVKMISEHLETTYGRIREAWVKV
ncbi:MAG: HIT domain-containing protein [Deltaproteobacteria bacterium]|nr:HIT domain-containing protein [Deltaproteobacteria bacterium]